MKKKTEEIINNILRELYKNSTPKGDFDKLMATKKRFCDDYFISKEDYARIVDAELSKHKLHYYETQLIKSSVDLGASPSFNEI